MAQRLTAKALAPIIVEEHGNLAAVARRFDVTRQAVHQYVNGRPELVAAVEDAKESTKDHVEGKLMAAINDGNVTAMIFWLKTQAKDRGYIERQDIGIGQAEPPAFDWDRAIGRLAPRPVGDTEPSGNGESPKRG